MLLHRNSFEPSAPSPRPFKAQLSAPQTHCEHPFKSQLPSLNFYFVRHGERLDHVNPDWEYNSPTPHDPPLSDDGIKQAYTTGRFMYDLESEKGSCMPSGNGSERTVYLFYTSPFRRCVQTACHMIRGLRERYKGHHCAAKGIQLQVEPGLGEWLSERYFPTHLPEEVFTTYLEGLVRDIADGQVPLSCSDVNWTYQHTLAEKSLPNYPESLTALSQRVKQTLAGIVNHVAGHLTLPTSSSVAPQRYVVVLVTHGACVNHLLWATSAQLQLGLPDYCSLTKARLIPYIAQTSDTRDSMTSSDNQLSPSSYQNNFQYNVESQSTSPSQEPRSTLASPLIHWQNHPSLPATTWCVDAQVYSGHLKL
ncbi:hypothetical protein IWQ62_003608 [Dispira parvispora]|uniref:Uncharacterized protein n=1 Tax=Dispira parvispora TaxID=1520584 RepID=A0A9W8AUI4_9FUNG|nr:hypothetical protein IWQ62_003608 [Dispira parvispora]